VVEAMRAHGYNVGGEQSGHIVLSDYGTTGDGLIAALQVLAMVSRSGRRASEVCRIFDPVPQRLMNVRFSAGNGGASPLEHPVVRQAIAEGEASLGTSGRLLIRKSGTEPLIRIMGEGDDAALVDRVVASIAAAVEDVGRRGDDGARAAGGGQ